MAPWRYLSVVLLLDLSHHGEVPLRSRSGKLTGMSGRVQSRRTSDTRAGLAAGLAAALASECSGRCTYVVEREGGVVHAFGDQRADACAEESSVNRLLQEPPPP